MGVVMGDVFQELLRRISQTAHTYQTTGAGIARDTGHYDAIGINPAHTQTLACVYRVWFQINLISGNLSTYEPQRTSTSDLNEVGVVFDTYRIKYSIEYLSNNQILFIFKYVLF